MGYTHYFAYDPTAASFIDAWPRMVADAQQIAAHVQSVLDIPLADGMGEGQPQIDERRIWLNGPSVEDLANETLLIDPKPWKAWDEQASLGLARWADYERTQLASRGFVAGFCKTSRKPYDIAVTSILLRCRHLAPEAFAIASDGAWEHDWHRQVLVPGSLQRPSPVDVVQRLFAQAELRGESPLVPNVWDGPSSATGALPRGPSA